MVFGGDRTAGLSGQPQARADIFTTKWLVFSPPPGKVQGGTFCDTGVSFASPELVSEEELLIQGPADTVDLTTVKIGH